MPTSAWPGDSEPRDLGAEGLVLDAGDEVAHDRQRDVGLEQRHAHLAQHVLDVLVGDAGLAAHRLDEAAQPVGEGRSHVVGVKYDSTLGDDSIVRSRRRRRHADGARAQRAEPRRARVLPRRSDPGRALCRAADALALLVGWIAHGVSIVIDIAGIGSDRPGARFGFAPALSVTLWLVLAVYELESRFVPLAGARRALAHARRRRRRARLAVPGPGPSAGRVDLGAAALAARHRVVRPVRRRGAARAAAQSRRAADATRAAARRPGRARACRCCASSA